MELDKRELTNDIIKAINKEINHLNSIPDTEKSFLKTIKAKPNQILMILEKNLKIVPKNHYKKFWGTLGFTLFGLPIGFILISVYDNMGLIFVSLLMGMAIGIAFGSFLDNKALKNGLQLDFDVKI